MHLKQNLDFLFSPSRITSILAQNDLIWIGTGDGYLYIYKLGLKKADKTSKLVIDETIKKKLCKTMSESQKSFVQKHVAFSKLNSSLCFKPVDNLKKNAVNACGSDDDKLRKFNSENILNNMEDLPQTEIAQATIERKIMIPKTINHSMRLINQSLNELNEKSVSTTTIKDNNFNISSATTSQNSQRRKTDSYDMVKTYLKSLDKLNSMSSNFSSPRDTSSLKQLDSSRNSEQESSDLDLKSENIFFNFNDYLAASEPSYVETTGSLNSSFLANFDVSKRLCQSKCFDETNQSFDEYNHNYISDDLWSGSSRISYEKRSSSPCKSKLREADSISLQDTEFFRARRAPNTYLYDIVNSETETTIVTETEKEHRLRKQISSRSKSGEKPLAAELSIYIYTLRNCWVEPF